MSGICQVTHPKAHSFHFQKRKADADPLEKEEDEKTSDDAPKEETKDTKKEEEVHSTTAELDEKKDEVTKPKRWRATNPYGAWEQVKEEKDP